MKDNLKIAVAIDGRELPAWKFSVLEKLSVETYVDIVLLFCLLEKPYRVTKSLWRGHMKLDRKYFRPRPDAFATCALENLPEAVPKTISQNLQAIEEVSPDIILWFSEGAIPQEVYQYAKTGVISLAHGPEGTSPEALLGYWEFARLQEVITSSLLFQKHPDEEAVVLFQTWSTVPSMSLSRGRNEHMWKLAQAIKRSVLNLKALTKSESLPANRYQRAKAENKINQPPGFFMALTVLINHAYRFAFKACRKLLYKEQWVLLVNTAKGPSTDFSDFTKILPPKDCFWADPFLVEEGNKRFLFFEELPYATDKGHLSVMEIDESGQATDPVKVLEKPYHLSYPFIFKQDDTYYMIPESYQDQNIQLYECIEFPHRWKHKMNLLEGLSAFDTTLYFYDQKWWMFTVISELKGEGHNDQLYLFFADTPFTSDWQSHPQNPIVSDVRSARPAGNIYEENGKLIRPSQDCGRKYGYGFNLNEIEILTTTDYKEKRILHVRPDWDASLSRTHSFNHLPGMTVIDAVIQRFRFG